MGNPSSVRKPMAETNPPARVRLTKEAVEDLRRLEKKDPQIVRSIFRKMLLLEQSPYAGEPLLGSLVTFRKLIIGDRDYRIVWRVTNDERFRPVLEIAEVWAAGARSDAAVYREMVHRAELLENGEDLETRALADILLEFGRRYAGIEAHAEPSGTADLPTWLTQALKDQLHLSDERISVLTQEEAQQMLAYHWSRPKSSPDGT